MAPRAAAGLPHPGRRIGAAEGLALALMMGAAACDSSSPAAPGIINLTGDWIGALPFRMPDEDWSAARVTLVQAGSAVTGEAVSRDGARYSLTGILTGTAGHLTVEDLPGTSTCAGIQLILLHLEFEDGRVVRISGRAAGRCFGTVAGTFELQRAP